MPLRCKAGRKRWRRLSRRLFSEYRPGRHASITNFSLLAEVAVGPIVDPVLGIVTSPAVFLLDFSN
jgi:hypothetical protein